MALYRLLSWLALPFLSLRAWLATGDRALWDERFARGPAPGHDGPTLWLHAASNGELASARPLIDALLARHPALRLLLTANSATGRALALGWALPRTDVRAAPLDLPPVLARFLESWRPAALVTVESELWPNRFALARARGLPVLLVGARLSERALRHWQRVGFLWRALAPAITWLSAQDDGSRRRFATLGLPEGTLGPVLNLKPLAAAPTLAPEPAPSPDRARTLLLASTHDGEEAALLDALAPLLASGRLRLILAPRHPRRGDELAALLAARALPFARRSAGGAPDAALYLADTLGEMALWYRAAGLTFVGGSLVDRGGHTPFEPAAHDSALLHGPHVANFAEPYAALDAAGGAIAVADGAALAAAVARLLGDGEAQAALARAARRALFAKGAPEALAPALAAIARHAHL